MLQQTLSDLVEDILSDVEHLFFGDLDLLLLVHWLLVLCSFFEVIVVLLAIFVSFFGVLGSFFFFSRFDFCLWGCLLLGTITRNWLFNCLGWLLSCTFELLLILRIVILIIIVVRRQNRLSLLFLGWFSLACISFRRSNFNC